MSEAENSPHGDGNGLPPSLTISRFAAARGKEIEIMKKALSSNSGTKLAFQKLPKHMRRRAMSHNVKRLPRRLREIHLNQMKKSGLPPKQKCPSRKYRRRPYNLMSDYMRRQRKIKWLNTHIWHAKRFHMVEKWGYKLPKRPCDRAFRACYRATVSHCLIQDISYYNCVEIKGDYDQIVNNFKKITNPTVGFTIGAKCFSTGQREGKSTIFKNDGSKRAIGVVYFTWKPTQLNNKHVIWIWIHAAYYTEILDTLLGCFELKLSSVNIGSNHIYKSDDDTTELSELKFELNRFRLTGPLSTSVLHNCFHLLDNVDSLDWVKEFCEDNTQLELLKHYWNSLNSRSPAELPPHMILSLIVLDPRFFLPNKRTKSLPGVFYNYVKQPENSVEGPLWDSTIRQIVQKSKISNAQLMERRKHLLVPGSALEEKPAAIPIMLVQRKGKGTTIQISQNIGYGSGWDIIIPSSWAQSIWVSLIMWGARPGGLRESESISFHMDEDFLFPDTQAGITEENFESNKCKETFFKLPPNKRTNYNKFKIASPFQCNWKLLLNEWNEDGDQIKDIYVLRDKNILRNIQEWLLSKRKNDLPNCPSNCLLPISIRLFGKGLCKKYAIICLPKEGDLRNCPSEPNCIDRNEKLRKETRKDHKKLLKKLRRRRIRGKKKGKVIPIDMEVLKSYTSTMRKLWLPDPTTIRHSCTREVIGFVKYGDFNFLEGRSKALGYIALGALPSLLSFKCPNKVLIRNTNTRQYRIGTIEIMNS